jgi:hypothetical protein
MRHLRHIGLAALPVGLASQSRSSLRPSLAVTMLSKAVVESLRLPARGTG